MSEIHLALAEELEKLAAGYRALAGNQIETDEVTIQDISIILTEKMSKGKVVEIKSLLKKYGATKLVELKAEDYEAFYKEAKNL
ncbi:hypothetical protein [Anaerosalibacter bizertensis]|jgi:hypothetical protein|uniref:hypothetical protein n=1 Tax=Anaerosalibacter bizertensis TaxID=932217 RepID=UPI0035122E0E